MPVQELMRLERLLTSLRALSAENLLQNAPEDSLAKSQLSLDPLDIPNED